MSIFGSCLDMLIPNYERVFVLANGKRTPSLLDHLNARDLLVVFNTGNIPENLNDDVDVLWIHREKDSSGMYFGFEADNQEDRKRVFHVFVTERPNGETELSNRDDFLSYCYKSPPLSEYPIGKRVFGFSNRDKKIISPSTGFIFLSVLEKITIEIEDINVFVIGFGQFPNGWHGHAWKYERRRMSMMQFSFLTSDLKKDRWLSFRALIPDFWIRVFMDMSKKFRIKT